MRLRVALLLVAFTTTGVLIAGRTVPADSRIETLRAVGGLDAHVAGTFREAVAFQQHPSGEYYVFDRRAHTVYAVDADQTSVRQLIQVGTETGRLIQPGAFAMDPRTLVVADAPRGLERIQIFNRIGERIGGFTLRGRAAPRITVGNVVMNGIGSLAYTGRSLLVNHPETGGLVTEYSLSGRGYRTFGALRPTGHEADRDLHFGLNSGIPLIDPTGGYYFVFNTGRPMFRKYDADGRLLFERHIEGRELDPLIASLPTEWSRRVIDGFELPLLLPSVRTAAVSPDGQLWVGLMVPYTYVYDPDGEKVRMVQFRAAGTLSPTSFFFAGQNRLLVTPCCFEFRY